MIRPVSSVLLNKLLIQCRAHNATFATVVVGEESVSFVIHEALLTYHSPFFRAALNGGFEEAVTKKINLKEVRPRVFENFVHWLYYQRLPDTKDDPQFFAMWRSVSDETLLTKNLVYLNVFCEKYDAPALKRLTLDHLFQHLEDISGKLPSNRTIMYAFENLHDTSPLCRLLVDFFCDYADHDTWDDVGGKDWIVTCHAFEEGTPLMFFRSALQRYAQYALGERPFDANLEVCDYHEHKDAEEREACAVERAA